jgi:predicted transcriptional regulator
MPLHLTHRCRTSGLIAAAASLALAACEEPVERNAAENASIARGLEEVEAGQARSDTHVNEVGAAKREKSREEQQR